MRSSLAAPPAHCEQASTLALPGMSKASLLGFYMPRPCRSDAASQGVRRYWPGGSRGGGWDSDCDEEWGIGMEDADGFRQGGEGLAGEEGESAAPKL